MAEKESVPVSDPFEAVRDPQMPFLKRALNPYEAWRQLRERLSGEEAHARLRGIRVTRHKPGRRCLVEYEVGLESPGRPRETLVVLGKARVRGVDEKSYRVQRTLRETGFGGEDGDPGVPETLGTVPEFHMWLQRKVGGKTSTGSLAGSEGMRIARRIAELAHNLHQARVTPLRRPHEMCDELAILRERLSRVAGERPHLEARLWRVLGACERLGASVPGRVPCGIHRDFYPDQVLVDGDRLWLLDLDLYCEGDPALDIGNFLGHIEEQSLRTLGDLAALSDVEEELRERFLEISTVPREAIEAYTTLTLVCHVHISTQFADRRDFTEPLLEECERRLGR